MPERVVHVGPISDPDFRFQLTACGRNTYPSNTCYITEKTLSAARSVVGSERYGYIIRAVCSQCERAVGDEAQG